MIAEKETSLLTDVGFGAKYYLNDDFALKANLAMWTADTNLRAEPYDRFTFTVGISYSVAGKRDIDEDVSSIESILADDEDQLEPATIQPAPDYDRHDASVDDVLADDEMEDFSGRNVIEHTSIEELGNHLENAGIMGDVSTEVSFDSDKE